MKIQLSIIYLLLIFIGIFTSGGLAQTTFGSEEELKVQAEKLFNDDAFEEAYPLYSQLASLYPKDPNYNYRLGVCMLYAADDKERPLTFLEYAAKSNTVDKEVFFYLAKAYHLNYLFDLAIVQYQNYQKVASAAKAEKLQVNRQIEMCKNGKKLLRNLTDLVVIDKKEIDRTDFFRAYDISDIGGKLLAKPDETAFKTALDKKKKEKSIIYFSSDNNQIYFSSYGDDPEHGKDIYIIRKLSTGKLSPPQTLGYPVNTPYDEDFPFLHPSGKVLYFCSKGHNSMGGYDIFKSTLNEETNTWNKPVNMDFPINSPDDDILYITNADEKEAYFSSARSSPTGKTNVYHISVERKPVDMAIINGVVLKNSDNQDVAVKITVKDIESNEIEGIVNSKAETGSYELTLPNGGKLMYTVEAAGFPTQSVMVTLPLQSTLKPFRQELSYEPGTGKLIVKNLTSEEDTGKETSYASALSFIKERSKMEVTTINGNATIEYLGKLDSTSNSTPQISKSKKNTSLSNADIIKIAYADAQDVETEAKKLKDQANTAMFFANQKNELAQNKFREASQLTEAATAIKDNDKKQASIAEASAITNEAEQLNQETVAAFNLAKRLELNAAAKQTEADLSKQYAIDLEAAVKSTNSQTALAKLDEQQKKIDMLNQQNNESGNITNSLKFDAENKKQELEKAIQTSADIKQEIIDGEALITGAAEEAAKETNENIKQGLLNQLEGLKEDNAESKKELVNNDARIAKLQKEYDGINNEIELVNSVLDKAGTGDASASIAEIDKNKLEQQVNTIKNASAAATPADKEKNAVAATKTTLKNDTAVAAPAATPAANTGIVKNTPDTLSSIPVAGGYDKEFENGLKEINAITDEVEKEKKRAALFKNWIAVIDKEIVSKQQQLITEKDLNNRIQLSNDTKELKRQLTEKQALMDAANAFLAQSDPNKTGAPPADTLIAAVPGTTIQKTGLARDTLNNAPATGNLAVNNQTNTEQPVIEKAKKDSIQAAQTNNVQQPGNEPISVTKETAQTDKQKTETDATAKPLPADQLNTEKQPAEKTLVKNDSIKTAVAGTDKNEAANVPETALYYSTVAKENIIKANDLNQEADEIISASNEIKTQADNQPDIIERNRLYENAEIKMKLAETKKTEAATYFALANEAEYKDNQNALNQLAHASLKKEADELAIAELIKDEASVYFNKAKASRKDAALFETFYAQQTALNEAYKNEQTALDRQNKALQIYKKYHPDFIVLPAEDFAKVKTAAPVNETAAVKTVEKDQPEGVIVLPTNEVPVAKITDTVKSAAVVAAETLPGKKTNVASQPDQTITADSATTEKQPGIAINDNKGPAVVKKQTTTVPGNKNNDSLTAGTNDEKVTAAVKNKTENNFEVPEENNVKEQKKSMEPIAKEVFETRLKPAYSASKPIPINEKLPEGLLFKVQIGAFRNPIPQDLFKGITPITGETTTQGFIRYTAGVFTTFKTADKVKQEIRKLGYPDAFVVAFYNGKRISVDAALAKLNATETAPLPLAGSKKTTDKVTAENANTTAPPKTVNNVTVKDKEVNTTGKDIAVTKNVSKVDGLFYTVQIGVFSSPVKTSELYNIQPLYTETTPDGYFRYNTGIYNDMAIANEAKNKVVAAGISDAFVTRYYKGKRLSVIEAAKLSAQGVTIMATSPSMNVLPTFNNKNLTPDQQQAAAVKTRENDKPVNKPVPGNLNPAKEQKKNNVNSKIIFKIQIGIFKDQVPLEMANKFLKINKKGITNYVDENGLIIYTVGSYATLEEAEQQRLEVISQDIPDAFIIADHNGKRISVEEAKKILNIK